MSSQDAKKTSAVVLLSGGLDSATCLAMARAEGFACHALSFDYGQRHAGELEAARLVASRMGAASHRVIQVDLAQLGGSALTDPELEVPLDRDDQQLEAGIPITYVPARNTVFLSYALALAEVLPARDIFIGVNAVDYSGYPDCRPAFVEAFERVANLATRVGTEGGDHGRGIRIRAPLQRLSKGEIIREGLALGVDYGVTRSCYAPAPGDLACGRCDACTLRLRGFAEAGAEDPAPYMERGDGGRG